MKFENALHVTVIATDEKQLAGVYAVLASSTALAAALAAISGSGNAPAPAAAKPVTEKPSATEETQEADAPASAGTGEIAQTDASLSDDAPKVDAAGTPFDPARHTGTIVKSGLWRMKAGLSRGEGEGEDAIPKGDGTGTSSDGPAPAASDTATAPADEEEDEFAAFVSTGKTEEATAEIPARTWTDADLSALCNQAATKLGDPAPVRDVIAPFIPEGETPHSRNIPADKREEFAVALETKAGITYAG